jgi:hypothetical protein
MPEPTESASAPSTGEGGTNRTAESGAAAEPLVHAANPVERSRFSQWLASFGLGEIPMPLLTRRRGQQ